MADAEGMGLDEYVSQTLRAIIGGILDAQADKLCGPYVGRSPNDAASMSISKDGDGNVVSPVSFDLATTVEGRSGVDGGGGIKVVPWLSLEGKARKEDLSSAVSRISFTVTISIPVPDAQRADDQARSRRRDAAMEQAIRRANKPRDTPW
jgi:hypothetical protein